MPDAKQAVRWSDTAPHRASALRKPEDTDWLSTVTTPPIGVQLTVEEDRQSRMG